MFAAVRNAARCVYISAAKYTIMPPKANANAAQPYFAIPTASVQFGATRIRSRAASQIQT